MTHAVAEVVLVEHFRVFVGDEGWPYIECPVDDCGGPGSANEIYTIGELLTVARRHILDVHPGGDPLTREHAYTVALHAVDNLAGNPYPLALIAEEQVPADDPTVSVRVCEATGNSVRGPLLPYEADGTRRWICRACFARCRRNASHVADPLPMPDGAP